MSCFHARCRWKPATNRHRRAQFRAARVEAAFLFDPETLLHRRAEGGGALGTAGKLPALRYWAIRPHVRNTIAKLARAQ
jgi:hypothetical protein